MQAREFLDFSKLEVKPNICIRAGEIASNLIATDSFIEGPIRNVLRSVAFHSSLDEPTTAEMAWIKDHLRCQVLMTDDPNVYMQCAPDQGKIFINTAVTSLYTSYFCYNSKMYPKPFLCQFKHVVSTALDDA
jgi:hypothetical protein